MIVVMEPDANATHIQHMVQQIEGMGLKAHVIHGTERTVIAAIGEKREQAKESLESGPGVASVVPF
jgi:3-deoxy-7-phosphoheptulonate synthase